MRLLIIEMKKHRFTILLALLTGLMHWSLAESVALAADETVWVEDTLPPGATAFNSANDVWNWVSTSPAPFSGKLAHQSNLAEGVHEHFFNYATTPIIASAGQVFYSYVFIDPENKPDEIMVHWFDGVSWDHRAYWGANKITYGDDNTAGRRFLGPLPAAGSWVRLEVSAAALGLENVPVVGMCFSLFNGRATWDRSGISKATLTAVDTTPASSAPVAATAVRNSNGDLVWMEDSLPAGAKATNGVDGWNWVSSSPAPFSGTLAHQSSGASGVHEHLFDSATTTITPSGGDFLYCYVYIDTDHPPTEIMLHWYDGTWEHRAYWGSNDITYGNPGTTSRHYMGGIPPAGRWVRLEIPAAAVGLEGRTISGMCFSESNGRATWDQAGVFTPGKPGVLVQSPSPPSSGSNASASEVDYIGLQLPALDDHLLHVLSPTLLEVKRINTKPADNTRVTNWDFISGNSFQAPNLNKMTVLVDGKPVALQGVTMKRRPLYAPIAKYDIRIENTLILQLGTPLKDWQTVEVTNPDGTLWPTSFRFTTSVDPMRYSPAIHINQQGFTPNLPKKAYIGYYLGDWGELDVSAAVGFQLVSTTTNQSVYQGAFKLRQDVGFETDPVPYQRVLEADFSDFNTPGEYQLEVPGLGASLPFVIDDGVAMSFARTYALGIYHQRCGGSNVLPYTRFIHDACHTSAAEIPSPEADYSFTWKTILSKNLDYAANPRHTAPELMSEATQRYPFINKGMIDVSGGHHDAGDYSKYTINSAALIHYLMFTVDAIDGAAQMDNLGVPESGDGIPDILQEAKWEADFLAKMQDADGGFYFLVYPKTREYENNVLPDHGDQQVVWPKNTAVTAASVAALAQCASSPLMKRYYAADAARYLQKAQLGWKFLTDAIAKYGKDGSYQKVTFYGDNFMHDDELAWAACEMYLATKDVQYQQKLFEWFPNPSDPATYHWGWQRVSECWGNAIRDYAFAVKTGRLSSDQQDPNYLSKCRSEIIAAANDALKWSQQNAYATSFPNQTKVTLTAGWYFSLDQASNIAVAQALAPSGDYMQALVGNLNYEAGGNPVNVTYVSGIGMRRQRELVHQYAQNDRRVLPPDGFPIGNMQTSFDTLLPYGKTLQDLNYPRDDAARPVPVYDRWGDTFNLVTELITVNQARSLLSSIVIASGGPASARNASWKGALAQISVAPKSVNGTNTYSLSVQVPNLSLTNARIIWEARDQEPQLGSSVNIVAKSSGEQWAEVEVEWPDGRRAFGSTTFNAN